MEFLEGFLQRHMFQTKRVPVQAHPRRPLRVAVHDIIYTETAPLRSHASGGTLRLIGLPDGSFQIVRTLLHLTSRSIYPVAHCVLQIVATPVEGRGCVCIMGGGGLSRCSEAGRAGSDSQLQRCARVGNPQNNKTGYYKGMNAPRVPVKDESTNIGPAVCHYMGLCHSLEHCDLAVSLSSRPTNGFRRGLGDR